jgi:hypothetical protein
MIRHLLTIVSFACAAGMAYCVVYVFRCTIKMVGARKDGVSIFEAMAGTNILRRRPQLYKPEASQWSERYFWSLICAWLFFFAAVGFAMLRQWVGGETIGFLP